MVEPSEAAVERASLVAVNRAEDELGRDIKDIGNMRPWTIYIGWDALSRLMRFVMGLLWFSQVRAEPDTTLFPFTSRGSGDKGNTSIRRPRWWRTAESDDFYPSEIKGNPEVQIGLIGS